MIFTREEAIKTIEENIKWLNDRTAEYDAGHETVSDVEWDRVYFALMKMENEWEYYSPNSPTQSIHYSVMSELEKRTHNHPMLSLNKTKDWNEFLRYFGNKDVVGMLKMDGLTCSLRYEKGYLVGAETRGNGVEGEDVLHNALVIKNIPNKIDFQEELIIDGEIVCTLNDFEAVKNIYANPRNYAAGSIRLLDAAECAKRNLKFYAWNVVKGGTNKHIDNLNLLFTLGFTVTPWVSSFDQDAKEFLIEKAQEEGLPIDGLVGRFNDIVYGESLGATAHHSRAAYAFKFADETNVSYLRNIEWTMGRTGQITPVAIFEPIELDGSTIERASLHNISIMKDTLHGIPWKGQKVTIYKANMIIPQILEGEEASSSLHYPDLSFFEIPSVCPICGQPTEIACQVTSEVLMCTNPACEGKLINRIEHFGCKKGLNILGLSKATLEKLIDWGWINSCKDLFELKQYTSEWVKKPGFGIKSVQKVLDAIEASRSCDLAQFITALGIPLIGSTASKELAKHFGCWDNFIAAALDKDYPFYNLPNFGFEMNNSIIYFDYTEAIEIVNNYITFKTVENIDNSQKFENEIFVITGAVHHWKNRDEVKSFIESNGGKVTSSVSKNTTYLLNNDINSTSSKNMAAKKLGITIITEEDLLRLLEN